MGAGRSTQVVPIDAAAEEAAQQAGRNSAKGRSSAIIGSKEDIQVPQGHLLTKYGILCPRTNEWFTGRNEKTLSVAIAFVPWIIMQSYFEGTLDSQDSVITHRGEGAVIFSDASGFTALTERLAQKPNGAELLSECLTSFFTPLIDIITSYRGDVIKFSGDALTIYIPAIDDTTHPNYHQKLPPHGTYGLKDLGGMATAVLRASACCIEIHRRLHMFDTGVDGVVLCLHIGVGCGEVTILQVGGVVPPETRVARYEYVIAGPPLEQISIAEPLAQNGETCLSPQAWEYAKDWAVEGRVLGDEPPATGFHILENLDAQQYTFPCVRHAAIERDLRYQHKLRLTELNLIRRYIPSTVFKQIENNTLTYVNEMRTISTIFISGSGVDVSSDEGSQIAQELVTDVQRVCYAHEGSMNKFLVDDKGMLFLLVYGLPPMVHIDDPARAVLACLDIIKIFRRMDLVCRCGVSTGRNYCGVVGSAGRMEYTVLGDTVNLAARLMCHAAPNWLLTDETTRTRSLNEISYKALAPIKVKGKANTIPIYEPEIPMPRVPVGIMPDKSVKFPWPCQSANLGGKSMLTKLDCWEERRELMHLLEGPRSKGGALVISGEHGLGTTELTECLVTDTLSRRGALPIFSTMEIRPGPAFSVIQELLRSLVLAFRDVNSSLTGDEQAALLGLTDGDMATFVGDLRPDLGLPSEVWFRRGPEDEQACEKGTKLAQQLLQRLLKDRPVTCVLTLRSGSSMFDSAREEEELVFWDLASQLVEMSEQPQASHSANPLLVVLTVKGAQERCPVGLQRLVEENSDNCIMVAPLSDENILEYISLSLGLLKDLVPSPLHRFVATLTRGNALFISETIDSLLHHGHIRLLPSASGKPAGLEYTENLESIDVADWITTGMVGGTMCMLESLEPLQNVVVKMATVFHGSFTVADLGASSCSRWSGATYFEAFRLFYAVTNLCDLGILERAAAETGNEFLVDGVAMECYRLNNMLIRKVGDMLVLEAQRKIVKRQALVDRVLARSLPEKMEELRRKKAIPHIPWYYQIEQPEQHSRRA